MLVCSWLHEQALRSAICVPQPCGSMHACPSGAHTTAEVHPWCTSSLISLVVCLWGLAGMVAAEQEFGFSLGISASGCADY